MFLVVFDLVLQTAVATEDALSSKSNLTVSFPPSFTMRCLIMLVTPMTWSEGC